jgi:hypothetical protein
MRTSESYKGQSQKSNENMVIGIWYNRKKAR